ncbi:hypothetical protein ThrDRAFT_03099 [Frankia casuarinae]|uniref:Superfamily I DNA and RNA helicases and helicase subunits-like n=1 Tax=Frankia casuarinae (strain DSM 45818 / CECT 9043 / HFP020203 / CcI3) TaxID=106370 RepID=Q2J6J6_FRACC|nr:AAA domain-containing protein [Frankia casuarinae]ABD13096.1 superfamily I DNA and RNA helicases and helicase subunits-like [Frankia casuarinae]EYT91255.1 hypothetical protein ThrDRAFT_03099 [Frankia casuarinae]
MTTQTAGPERHAALADRCHRLVRFLHEVAAARSGRIRTIEEHPLTVWLADIPAGVPLSEHAGAGEVLLTAPAATVLPPPPPPPAILAGQIVLPDAAGADPDQPPVWNGAAAEQTAAEQTAAAAAYQAWLPRWQLWATRARVDAERRNLHNTLHAVAARVAQEGDALELVLATGLLTWQPPGGPTVREHLLTTRLTCDIDPVTSDIRVRVPAGATTRLADGPLLDGIAGFRRERTNALHERLRGRPSAPLGPDDIRLLRDWLALALDVPTDGFEPDLAPPAPDSASRPRVTFAPAFVLRTRDQAALLTYYERMLDVLRGDGPPPLGLVQLVETLDAADRLAWLEAEGATSGAELGADPLLPLPASPEQARVLERLRHDNGVVVEGPPGTGKTHTIANLVCALLAEGQRVLVTSQKSQALRVLREKLPPDLQRLCVSFTDTEEARDAPVDQAGNAGADLDGRPDAVFDPAPAGAEDEADELGGIGVGSPELAASVSALAAEKATYHPEALDRRIVRAAARRQEAIRARDVLADRARALRLAEHTVHPDSEVAAGWGGTRASIAARVRAEADASRWLPRPVPRSAAATTTARTTATGSGSVGPAPVPPPLTDAEALELHALLRSGQVRSGQVRSGQDVGADRSAGPVVEMSRFLPAERFADLVATARAADEAVRLARAAVRPATRGLLDTLAAVDPAVVSLDPLQQAVASLSRALEELDGRGQRSNRRHWVPAALDDALAGRDRVLWAKVAAATPMIAEATRHVTELGLHAVALPTSASPDGSASAADAGSPADPGFDPAALLARGEALREYLDAGGELRRRFRPKVQKEADTLLTRTLVDGVAPTTPELLDLVLVRLRAEVAVEAATRGWVLVGIAPRPTDPFEVRLSRLVEAQEAVTEIQAIVAARNRVVAILEDIVPGRAPAMDSAERVRDLAAVMAALRPMAAATDAERALGELREGYAGLATAAGTPSEVAELAGAVAARNVAAYTRTRAALATTMAAREVALRRDELLGRLRAAHPDLADLLVSTAGATRPNGAEIWPARLAAFTTAWSWAVAASWLTATAPGAATAPGGPAGPPVDLDAELDAAEDMVAAATAELAGARAWKHCLERMGAEQSAALRAYADAVAASGTFGGRHAERFRQAAREAMEIAQTAVPAWVMPIREVLSTIPAVRDSFDVVIVDEGSQAGLDSLFLLWLAPRVIVVGDDRQCTPPVEVTDELDRVFDRLEALLPEVPAWLRVGFTPRSSLFTLLRTRFGEVIRLREHFRCMPEIIEWSSAMFYRDAPLLPLRQFGADRLPPLVARFVPHGFTTDAGLGPRNPAEADALVAQVLSCAEDPRYARLSFGVVVPQGTAQAALIRDQLADRMSAAEHQRRRLRVGVPADFQGDERDVVFLSLVVAPDSRITPLTRLEYQRRFNVAASRARDQVWLFHSVPVTNLDPRDLRHNYLSYVLSTTHPAAGGRGEEPPALAEVPTNRPHPAFGSLFEQRVFREIVGRGYLVTPQVEINGRRVDLVVSGGRARLAVECDGDVGSGPDEIAHEFARERELRRAGWRFWRVRQSEFELDADAALASLWPRLARAGIAPVNTGARGLRDEAATGLPRVEHSTVRASADEALHRWRPIALSDLEGLDDAPPDADPRGSARDSAPALRRGTGTAPGAGGGDCSPRAERVGQAGGPVTPSGSNGAGRTSGS